jgi:hypothetical protein
LYVPKFAAYPEKAADATSQSVPARPSIGWQQCCNLSPLAWRNLPLAHSSSRPMTDHQVGGRRLGDDSHSSRSAAVRYRRAARSKVSRSLSDRSTCAALGHSCCQLQARPRRQLLLEASTGRSHVFDHEVFSTWVCSPHRAINAPNPPMVVHLVKRRTKNKRRSCGNKSAGSLL